MLLRGIGHESADGLTGHELIRDVEADVLSRILPMAVVILYGLLSSTALNMFVVPALYRQFGALAQPRKAALNPATEGV